MNEERDEGIGTGDRIHDALDGSIDPRSLSDAEIVHFRRLAVLLDEAATPLRSVRPPDLTASVMAAVRQTDPATAGSAPRSLLRWLWTPRPLALQLRPVYGFAALALCLMLGVRLSPPSSAPVEEPATAALLYVQFRLDAPGATRVDVAGTFTRWEPAIRLTETAPGVWSVLVPLKPGVYDYTFLIDGTRWVPDP